MERKRNSQKYLFVLFFVFSGGGGIRTWINGLLYKDPYDQRPKAVPCGKQPLPLKH